MTDPDPERDPTRTEDVEERIEKLVTEMVPGTFRFNHEDDSVSLSTDDWNEMWENIDDRMGTLRSRLDEADEERDQYRELWRVETDDRAALEKYVHRDDDADAVLEARNYRRRSEELEEAVREVVERADKMRESEKHAWSRCTRLGFHAAADLLRPALPDGSGGGEDYLRRDPPYYPAEIEDCICNRIGPEVFADPDCPVHADEPVGDEASVTGWTQFYDYEAEVEGGDTLAIHTDGHKDGGFGISDSDVLRDLRAMIDQILAPTDEPVSREGDDRIKGKGDQSNFNRWEIFKVLREAYGCTVREVAERTGVSASYVSEVENGNASPSYRYVVKFAEAFDLYRDWLLMRAGHLPSAVVRCRPSVADVKDAMHALGYRSAPSRASQTANDGHDSPKTFTALDDIEYAASQLTSLPHEAHKMSDREIIQHAVDMGEEILNALKNLSPTHADARSEDDE